MQPIIFDHAKQASTANLLPKWSAQNDSSLIVTKVSGPRAEKNLFPWNLWEILTSFHVGALVLS